MELINCPICNKTYSEFLTFLLHHNVFLVNGWQICISVVVYGWIAKFEVWCKHFIEQLKAGDLIDEQVRFGRSRVTLYFFQWTGFTSNSMSWIQLMPCCVAATIWLTIGGHACVCMVRAVSSSSLVCTCYSLWFNATRMLH